MICDNISMVSDLSKIVIYLLFNIYNLIVVLIY